MKNEKTSPRVAKIAGKALRNLVSVRGTQIYQRIDYEHGVVEFIPICPTAHFRTLAGSVLTQAPDRPERRKKL